MASKTRWLRPLSGCCPLLGEGAAREGEDQGKSLPGTSSKQAVRPLPSRYSPTCLPQCLASYHCDMPDIASTLKSEIARIARKEVRSETLDVKKASAQYRSHIASLRRRVDELDRELKRVKKDGNGANRAAPADASEAGVHRRFSAARLAATRNKLGLSAADFGTLIGVTGQSIYKWESGETRPRAAQLESIAAVRGIGKREAAHRLEVLRAAA